MKFNDHVLATTLRWLLSYDQIIPVIFLPEAHCRIETRQFRERAFRRILIMDQPSVGRRAAGVGLSLPSFPAFRRADAGHGRGHATCFANKATRLSQWLCIFSHDYFSRKSTMVPAQAEMPFLSGNKIICLHRYRT